MDANGGLVLDGVGNDSLENFVENGAKSPQGKVEGVGVFPPEVEYFPALLQHSDNGKNRLNFEKEPNTFDHKLLFDVPRDEDFFEKFRRIILAIFAQIIDSQQANICQISLISFCFYFYNGMLVLPSIDIIKKEMGENEVLFYSSILFMISGILCFISSTVIGTLSDKIGRKPFLVLSAFVLFIPLTFMLLKKYMIALFLNAIAYILMTGPSISYISVADVTTLENRNKGFGLVSSSLPLAGILGPLISVLLYSSDFEADTLSLTTLTLFLIGFIFSLVFYIVYIVPEPLSLDQRNKTYLDLKKLNPFSKFIDSLCDKRLFIIIFVTTLITIPQEAVQGTYTVFLKTYLRIPNVFIAILIAQLAIVATFSLGYAMNRLIAMFNHKMVLFLTISIQLIAFIISSFATNILMLIINGFLLSFSYVSYPTIIAYTSHYSEPTLQGAVLGAITGIRQLLFAIVPMLVWLLNKMTNVNFGLPVDHSRFIISPAYLIVAGFNLLAIPFLFFLDPID